MTPQSHDNSPEAMVSVLELSGVGAAYGPYEARFDPGGHSPYSVPTGPASQPWPEWCPVWCRQRVGRSGSMVT
jgi:hypothetical protein